MLVILTDDRTRQAGAVASMGQCNCDCDCACADVPSCGPVSPVPPTRLVRNPALQTVPLDETFRLAFVPSGDHIAALSTDAVRVLDGFARPLDRAELPSAWSQEWGDALDRAVDELARLGLLIRPDAAPVQPPVGQPSTLVAWMHVTNACNLRCHYCYLDKTDEVMSVETGRAALDAVLRSAVANGFSGVKIKYAGGEPTLNFPLLMTLHRYAVEESRRRGLGVEGVILSNGVALSHAMLDAMSAHRLRLMISLDGIGAAHDRQRAFANGVGSFGAASRAVERARGHGIIPDISITVTDRTVDSLAETMAWVLDRDLPFSINFYRENDASLPFEDLTLSERRLIEGMREAFKVVEAKLPRRSLLGALADRANLGVPHARTCGVGTNYLVIDQRGRVSKCQMQIKRPLTDVYTVDPLAAIRADKDGIQNLPVDEKDGCKECEWRYWCAGSCPLATFRATGRYDVRSPMCRVYKALFPELLRLEGLRLQKYAGEPLH